MRYFLIGFGWLLLWSGGLSAQVIPASKAPGNEIIPADLPPAARYKGLFKEGLGFEDRGGENFLLFSELWNQKHTENTLYAVHYVQLKGSLRQLWSWEVSRDACELQMVPGSFQSADLDGDGYTEISFLSQRKCTDRFQYELILAEDELILVYQFNAQSGRFANPNQALTDLQRWQAETIREEILRDGQRAIVLEAAGHAPNTHIVRRKEGYFSEYQWFDDKGQRVLLPKESARRLRNAVSVHFLNPEMLLFLYGEGVGGIHTRTHEFESWLDLSEGSALLTDWAWSPDQQKFAFAVLNKRQYKETATAIYVVDLAALEFKEYPVPVYYSIGERVQAADLQFGSDGKIGYEERLPKGEPQLSRRAWLDLSVSN